MAVAPSEDLAELIYRRQPRRTALTQNLERAAMIATHYSWAQMGRRLLKTLRAKSQIGKVQPSQRALNVQLDDATLPAIGQVAELAIQHAIDHPSHAQSNLETGRIVLLAESRSLGSPLHWSHANLADASHLWRFHLHYHEFLLAALGRSSMKSAANRAAAVWGVIESWLNQFSDGGGATDAWHPYCISRRVPVWLCLLSSGAAPEALQLRMRRSLTCQTDHLCRNLELDLGGNHYFENLTAIGLAAAAFRGDQRGGWLKLVERALLAELDRQLLPHGEHFELAPTYHCQILGNVLRLIACLRPMHQTLAAALGSRARKMIDFLNAILHPEGEIPLLGDSVFHESYSVVHLRELARLVGISWPSASTARSQSIGPYVILRTSSCDTNPCSTHVLFDRGDVAAARLPAHGHCDLLNLEVSIAANRWVTDSGTYDYEDSMMRAYCRSSAAHNVVTVDDANQCDIWSKFRMGRRARVVGASRGGNEHFQWAYGQHDGYRRLGLPRLQRLVMVGQGDVIVLDRFSVRPSEEHRARGWIHLSPSVRAETQSSEADVVKLCDSAQTRFVEWIGVNRVSVLNGWYCPTFGRRESRIVLAYETNLWTDWFGWRLTEHRELRQTRISGSNVAIQDTDGKLLFSWNDS